MTWTIRRRVRVTLALCGSSLAIASAATAFAVDVTGRIEVPSGYGTPPPSALREGRSRDFYWEERNFFLDVRSFRYQPARHIAVVLTGPGTPVAESAGFRLRNGGLVPDTIVARPGEALQIANDDPLTYELTADGLASFGAVPTPPGRTRTVDGVAQAGHWTIRDRVQSHVTGHLHVVADLIARAEVRADGSYLFRGVPAGAYTFKVFEGEREVVSRPVQVVEGREPLTIEPIRLSAPPSP